MNAKERQLLRAVILHLRGYAKDIYQCNSYPRMKEKRPGDSIYPYATRLEYRRCIRAADQLEALARKYR